MKFLSMFTLLVCLFFTSNAQSVSIYSFKIDSITGSKKIDFNDFRGKKILIVNTASGDTTFKQYKELIQLYQLYKDKLVIIAIPSNNFGNEQGTDSQIASIYLQNATNRFPVAAKLNVTNPQIHALFKWLTRQTDNQIGNSEIKNPFYKYLIGTDGKLVASFNHKVNPMHQIIKAIIER